MKAEEDGVPRTERPVVEVVVVKLKESLPMGGCRSSSDASYSVLDMPYIYVRVTVAGEER